MRDENRILGLIRADLMMEWQYILSLYAVLLGFYGVILMIGLKLNIIMAVMVAMILLGHGYSEQMSRHSCYLASVGVSRKEFLISKILKNTLVSALPGAVYSAVAYTEYGMPACIAVSVAAFFGYLALNAIGSASILTASTATEIAGTLIVAIILIGAAVLSCILVVNTAVDSMTVSYTAAAVLMLCISIFTTAGCFRTVGKADIMGV